jgi:hypothetical protein
VEHAHYPSAQEAEARGLRVGRKPGLQWYPVSKNNKVYGRWGSAAIDTSILGWHFVT